MRRRLAGPLAALLLALAGCQGSDEDRPVIVDVIGRPAELASPLRADRQPAAQVMLGATAQGLVAFDAQGEVVAALAESWIVADEGQSYIFRLRRAKWANGTPVKAEDVARLLQQRLRANPDMLAGLKPVVRAMTERVIEIRLDTALPPFLQVLAQPRLALLGRGGGSGPFIGKARQGRFYLTPVPDLSGSVDDDAPHEIQPRDRRTIEADRAALAIVRFQNGRSDIMLGGRFQHLPLIPMAHLGGGTDVRADPVPGLFGLALVGDMPFLADKGVRDALSRAVDRTALSKTLNLQGWTTATTPLPAKLDLADPPADVDWAGDPMPDRIAAARAAVDRWSRANGAPPVLRIALPTGPGATLLFIRLANDYRQLGLRVDRVGPDEPADLRLIDAVAAFDSALWYLSQLDCTAGLICDPNASARLEDARAAPDHANQARALSDAERLIVANAGYIPLGLPIRWSLVDRRLTGFAPSPRGVHPLNQLFAHPN